MKLKATQRGFLLIVAVIIIAVAAVMAAVIITLNAGSGQAGGLGVSSTQALYAAEAGIDHATRLYANGTACGSLQATIGTQTVGNGSYTVLVTDTTITPASVKLIGAGVADGVTTTIQANSSLAGFYSHGLIRIDSELILYSSISGNSFLGVTRGFGGTSAVAHAGGAGGADVVQRQCSVRATGTSDTATRYVESALQLGPWAATLQPPGVGTILAAGTLLGTINTSFPAGENLIIAAVTLQNIGTRTIINPGDLMLVRNYAPGGGGTTLTSNFNLVAIGTGTPSASNRPQQTYFFVFNDPARPSGDTYSVVTNPVNNSNTTYELKMLVLNNVPDSRTVPGNIGDIDTGPIVSTGATGLAAGDNLVIARVQIDNGTGILDRIDVGNLQLRRTAPSIQTLTSNQYRMFYSGASPRATEQFSHMLIALDANAPANSTYEIQAQSMDRQGMSGDGNIMVIKGVGAAFGTTAALSTPSGSPLVTLATNFPRANPGAANIVISAAHYDRPAPIPGPNSSILTESINFNFAPQASSTYPYLLCGANRNCEYLWGSQLWLQTSPAPASPTFSLSAQQSGTSAIQWQGSLLAMHLHPIADRMEFFPP